MSSTLGIGEVVTQAVFSVFLLLTREIQVYYLSTLQSVLMGSFFSPLQSIKSAHRILTG